MFPNLLKINLFDYSHLYPKFFHSAFFFTDITNLQTRSIEIRHNSASFSPQFFLTYWYVTVN